MKILKALSDFAVQKDTKFLVIDGHAINALGYARQT